MAVRVRSGGGRNNGRERPPMQDMDRDDSVETPSQRIVKSANAVTYVVTEAGVKLGIRQLGALDEMRLARAIGADSGNAQYMLWCQMAAAICEIDGDKLPMPATALECEMVVQRLGNDGFAALMAYGGKLEAERQAAARRNSMNGGKASDAETEFVEQVKK